MINLICNIDSVLFYLGNKNCVLVDFQEIDFETLQITEYKVYLYWHISVWDRKLEKNSLEWFAGYIVSINRESPTRRSQRLIFSLYIK
jgi:hypothetical protein